MTDYDSSRMIDLLMRASEGDSDAIVTLTATTVPWAASSDYSEMILVQAKRSEVDAQGRIRIFNEPPDAGGRSQQCAEVYVRTHAAMSFDFIPLPSSFAIQDIKYSDGLFKLTSDDGRSVQGTVAQIRQATAEVRFALDGFLVDQLEECWNRIPSAAAAQPYQPKTLAENGPFVDKGAGTFAFEERLQQFIGRHQSGARSIEIAVGSHIRDEAMAMMPAVRSLLARLDDFDRKARGFAAERLLQLKNDAWLADGEDQMSAGQFVSCVSLESVAFEQNGHFTMWYTDGGVFLGHEIAVHMNAQGEPIDSEIAG